MSGMVIDTLPAGATRPWPADLLRLADLSLENLLAVLDLADRMKADPMGWLGSHRGETLSLIFEKPSTRTRVSFAAAAQRLGMLPIALNPNDLQLGRGETVGDTACALSAYSAAIVIRTFSQQVLAEMAEAASVPVINALSDDHHPCQVLADLMTIRERVGHLTGVRLAYVGDGDGNVVHSLMEAAALADIELAIACPAEYRPRLDAASAASRAGGLVTVLDDPIRAVQGADAVYTDVWVSMGEEKERVARQQRMRPYQVTPELMERARPGAIFLHCLPAHRGEEVAAAVIDGVASAVWQQAANRLPTEQALLHLLIAGG